MSQFQAVDSNRRQSKRKRAQVNYYEGGPDDEISSEQGSESQSAQVEEDFSLPKRKASRTSRPLPKRKIFQFLELPAEIRNMIYGYCLSSSRGITLVSDTVKYRRTVRRAGWEYIERAFGLHAHHRDPDDDDDDEEQDGERTHWMEPRPLVPALLAVNKQIHGEACKILYSNRFHMADTLTMHSFIVNMGPRAAALIKNITIRGWGGYRGMHKAYNHASFAALAAATNLEKLKIETTISWGREPKWVARQIYRDGFPWLEAVGVAKGEYDAAVDLIELTEDNFSGRSWRRPTQSTHTLEENMAEFKIELRKLLAAHAKVIWSDKKQKKKPVKKL
ncbi:hypothetical protein EJ04DRAFT_494072 [Polyplosphaeria fusca]|uniref:DUF7730 domain-containing protein n=1 Tax=Polyplosphaeria fusca TaxID=682080 RepID=A0A9P4V120_9PLEO|nr:hypothetical protein EJ04DRAFT_494072 [Polyplosphaeria fusca]